MSEPFHAPVIESAAPAGVHPPSLRWGFLGAGDIAGTLAECLAGLDGHELAHVGARDPQRATAFASRWGARAGGGYDDVIADPEVDVVYVNTTHPFHRSLAMSAVEAGKHLLVEKPAGLSATEATDIFAAARKAGVFAMEAMWMRTQPLLLEVQREVGDGVIGDIVRVQADFPVPFRYDPDHRLFDLSNGGGSLLDLGVYAAAFAWMFLGQPQSIQVMGSLAPTGVDHVVSMQWGYDSGATAGVFCTSLAEGPSRAVIMGRRGWVSIEPPFAASPTMAVIHAAGRGERILRVPSQGYAHQMTEVARCIRAGLLESPMVPHADTIGVLEVLDCARRELGVAYPQETSGDQDFDAIPQN